METKKYIFFKVYNRKVYAIQYKVTRGGMFEPLKDVIKKFLYTK